jgi:hypothetical protein
VAACAWYRQRPTVSPLFAIYEYADTRWNARSIQVLTLRDEMISTLTPFELPIGPQLFQAFGLPLVFADDRGAE